MQSILYSMATHWGIFLLGFVAGAFWATRPRDEADQRSNVSRTST